MKARTTSAEPNNYILQFLLCRFLHPPVAKALGFENRGREVSPKKPWKKQKIGRERPHFLGFDPPKQCPLGSLPPCGTSFAVPNVFFTVRVSEVKANHLRRHRNGVHQERTQRRQA